MSTTTTKKNTTAGSSGTKPTSNSTKTSRKRDNEMDTSSDETGAENVNNKRQKGNSPCTNCDLTTVLSALTDMKTQLEKLDKIDDLSQSLKELKDEISKNVSNVEVLQNNVEDLFNGLDKIDGRIEDLKHDSDKLETEMKRINLIMSGLWDEETETDPDLRSKVQNVFNSVVTSENVQIDTVSRLGKFNPTRPRLVKVRFASMKGRDLIWSQRIKTKSPVFINEDLPKTTLKAHAELRKKRRELEGLKIATKVNYNKLCVLTPTKTYQLLANMTFHELDANNDIPPTPFLGRKN